MATGTTVVANCRVFVATRLITTSESEDASYVTHTTPIRRQRSDGCRKFRLFNRSGRRDVAAAQGRGTNEHLITTSSLVRLDPPAFWRVLQRTLAPDRSHTKAFRSLKSARDRKRPRRASAANLFKPARDDGTYQPRVASLLRGQTVRQALVQRSSRSRLRTSLVRRVAGRAARSHHPLP